MRSDRGERDEAGAIVAEAAGILAVKEGFKE